MLIFSELKKGAKIILNSEPYEIIEASLMFKGRGHSTLTAKLKNLISGNIIPTTFHPSDSFEEAAISKIKVKYLYQHRRQYFFCEEDYNPPATQYKRFDLTEEQIGPQAKFLKPNQIIEGIVFEEKIINISLPIKINLKVIEAPPGLRGGRAEAGTKIVTLETGAKINVPLFIEEGDVIEVNTETGEYVRRIE